MPIWYQPGPIEQEDTDRATKVYALRLRSMPKVVKVEGLSFPDPKYLTVAEHWGEHDPMAIITTAFYGLTDPSGFKARDVLIIHGIRKEQGQQAIDVMRTTEGWEWIDPRWVYFDDDSPLRTVVLGPAHGVRGTHLSWLAILIRTVQQSYGKCCAASPQMREEFKNFTRASGTNRVVLNAPGAYMVFGVSQRIRDAPNYMVLI